MIVIIVIMKSEMDVNEYMSIMEDVEVYYGLRSIYLFLRELHLGRYND
ncbi:MAG: hypothetical protein EZS28_047887, partial [Streblomastix strix]